MSTTQRPQKRQLDELTCIYPNAAGIDIGSAEIVVAVPPDRDAEPVRVFATFTPDLHALAAWLLACGSETVAMDRPAYSGSRSMNYSNNSASSRI